MNPAADQLRSAAGYADLRDRWRAEQRGLLRWGGLWGSSKALLTSVLARDLDVPVLVVVTDPHAAELLLDDLACFGSGGVAFPAREGRMGAEAEVLRERFHALDLATRSGFRGVLVAPLAALLQPVPAAADEAATLDLAEGARIDVEALLQRLADAGFERVPAIGSPGEVARRGDILDLFAPSMGEPLRLEFFDDELESVRVFDIATQRTRHVLKNVRVPLAQDLAEIAASSDAMPLERLPEAMRVVRVEPAAIRDSADKLRFHGVPHVAALDRLARQLAGRAVLDLATLPGEDGTIDVLSVEEYCRGVAEGAALLADRAADGEVAVVCCATEAEAERLGHLLEDAGRKADSLVRHRGGLERGFRVPGARLTVLHHREFVPGHGAHKPKPRRGRAHAAETIESVLSLRPGDLVIHAVHGLARFRSLDDDHLELEFSGDGLLRVPASRVDLVERYIGAGSSAPTLDRLGSGSFERRRRKVTEAVEDMASELLEIQARRAAGGGNAFADGGDDQRAFEAAFPYEDTPDQATGTREIHADLGAPAPMDRLVCGDVGYGKTELAARAAFRVILAGFQVALLVPTTVLAEQHARSLGERFADWPMSIGLLSRIRPPAERKQVLGDLAAGRVDLVIGTHRLLSRDVSFKKLGLVIIDEEQRFGVGAKETLKRQRALVDILTLSATPIPRTLHMAMAGIRDITSLSTPPRGRMEIHTEIRYDDEDALIRESLRAELERGGQAFYVHNRIKDLEKVADRLRRLVPEASVATGHGQMEPRVLEKAMLQFVRGEAQILCSTTIVESGLDIPNANTIFLDGAHRYGLADLHQLRGRVGRGAHRGHCFLLIPRGQPLPLDARRRLKAVEELRYLGAGFQVALRDLEIRGAGNLLGAEQSGHIAAVGYETYRKLLRQAVARCKRRDVAAAEESPAADVSLAVAAALSPAYVPDEETRLQVLREFDRVREAGEVDGVLEALRDRFGPPPAAAANLVRLFFLKHRLGVLGLDAVQWVDDRLICTLREARRFERALAPTGVELRLITARRAHWILPEDCRDAESVLNHLYATTLACRLPGRRGQSRAKATRK